MIINPEFKPHKELEKIAVEYLQNKGYCVKAQTYHETMDNDAVKMLQRNYSITSLYIRARADRMAIRQDAIFEFEVKTHFSKSHNDLVIEILPLMIHESKSKFIKCLYVCEVNNRQFGFFADNIPTIKRALIPDTQNNKHISKIVTAWEKLRAVPISTNTTGGSNDPCIIISEKEINKLSDWRLLIS